MQDELDHALGPLRERLGRVEAVVAGEVDERERDEEASATTAVRGKASVAPSTRSKAKSTRNTEVSTSESVSNPRAPTAACGTSR